MAISLIRELAQKQKVTLTPQLKKSIDLLQLSRYEIIQRINEEININPFLEKVDQEPFEYSEYDHSFQSEYSKEIVENPTLRNILLNQVSDLNLNETENEISSAIIDCLDDSGELIDSIDEIENMLEYKFLYSEIENVLTNVIHTLDPPGVGFRNIKECIYIQLKRKDIEQNLLEIIEQILFENSGLDIESVKKKLKTIYKNELIDAAMSLIKQCDLAPGLNHIETQFIYPDLTISESDDNQVTFINDYFPVIRVDDELINSTKKELKNNPNESIVEKIQDAKWLLRSVKKRNETVLKVGEIICKKQYAFFNNKTLEMQPLSNKNISDELGLHPSTISRILRSKYIQTPKGIIPLRSFLISSVSKTRNVTPIQLMEIIKKIIETEKSKLSDQAISIILNKKGYSLARRTISKYRLKLNIPSSRKR